MHRKFRITVDGRAYDVDVEEIADEIPAPSPAGARPRRCGGAYGAGTRGRSGDEIAPLGGVVESIEVTVGETIAAGAKIATIEAMKMKTEVFAQGTGKVVAIAVKPGDPVDAGGILLTLA